MGNFKFQILTLFSQKKNRFHTTTAAVQGIFFIDEIPSNYRQIKNVCVIYFDSID